MINSTTVRSLAIGDNDRLDANFFISPGVAAAERISRLRASGSEVVPLGSVADRIWVPSRFARTYATPGEPSLPYLRPYDVFDFSPVAADRLSIARNESIDHLRLNRETILLTCSGRNLGPCTAVDGVLSEFLMSHDMIRIEIGDKQLRDHTLAFLQTATGQALLRRPMSGSVIDHLTVSDVEEIPIPLPRDATDASYGIEAARAMDLNERARLEIAELMTEMDKLYPLPTAPPGKGWSTPSRRYTGRLDAAFHHPVVDLVRKQLATDGMPLGVFGRALKPPRYQRYYVDDDHGRPVLSGRQLLQFQPINLRYVSDRSFKDSSMYVVSEGMTVFGAVGRAEGRLGQPALITPSRDGWLASEDVIRLIPNGSVPPAELWLSMSTRQAQFQVKALTFGSVIDHLAPEDVEDVLLPAVPNDLAHRASAAWDRFNDAELLLRRLRLRFEQSFHPETPARAR